MSRRMGEGASLIDPDDIQAWYSAEMCSACNHPFFS